MGTKPQMEEVTIRIKAGGIQTTVSYTLPHPAMNAALNMAKKTYGANNVLGIMRSRLV